MQNFTITEETLKKLETIHTDLNIIINDAEASGQTEKVFTQTEVIKIIEMAREGDMAFDSNYHEVETSVEVEVETKVNGGYSETTSHTIDAEVDLKAAFEDNMDKFKVTFDYDCAEAVLEAWEDEQERKKAAEMQSRPLTDEERAQLEANLEETRQRLESNSTAE
jgi:hypothetical protein